MRSNHSTLIVFTLLAQSTSKSWPKRLCDGENGYATSKTLSNVAKSTTSELHPHASLVISLTSFNSLAAIFRRRHTISLLEFMTEVAFIQKAHPIHDLLNPEKRGAQQPFRFV